MQNDTILPRLIFQKFWRAKGTDRQDVLNSFASKAAHKLEDPALSARLMLDANPPADDTETLWSIFCDLFWGRRTVMGVKRSELAYKRAMYWQLLLVFPAFPPLALIVLVVNLIIGMRPRGTRIWIMILFCMGLLWVFGSLSMAGRINDNRPVTMTTTKDMLQKFE